ncbi:hypothetical protein KQI42_17540 [Tissierella sp. MSJ-40]|uniref:Uncharacterized protein n=1 Tax=Tissierella simiarum TaxID=2841534 RepID=A0ABS6ECB6_9FIRM|nr:hypothetical protein [Tissierella simiarum]MBU5439823.1 hypothetical protein [Tissierella simiarum]
MYRSARAIRFKRFWIEKLDLFLKYRRLYTYKFIKQMSLNKSASPYAEYLAWMREEIIDHKPFIKIDYQRLLESL